MSDYKKAVDYLATYVEASAPLYQQPDFPNVETQLEYALKILRDQEQYGQRAVIN